MVSGVDLMFLFKDGLSLIIRIIVSLSTLTIFPVFLKKTLWPLFMDVVQLSLGYRATTRTVYFLPLNPEEFLVLI